MRIPDLWSEISFVRMDKHIDKKQRSGKIPLEGIAVSRCGLTLGFAVNGNVGGYFL